MSMLEAVKYSGKSRTKPSFRDECDINKIVAKARSGHAVTHVRDAAPVFMDVSEVGDYKSALDMLRSTDRFFAGLPSGVRKAFDNDPAKFLDELDTTEGRAKLELAGLVPPTKEAPTPPAPEPPAH